MSTDFQLVPTTDADPTPLDTEPIEQVTVPAPTNTPATRPEQLDHTPGGLPAIPLAVITANSTIAGLSAAAIVAGPLGAAAAGAVALGGVAFVRASAARTARRRPAAKTRTASGRTGSGASRSTGGRTGTGSARSAGGSSAGLSGASRSGTTVRKASGTVGSAGAKGKTTSGRITSPARGGVAAKKATGTKAAGAKATGSSTGAGKKPLGRVGQVKALRKDKAAAAPSRKERRVADTTARRGLKDARRDAKRAVKAGGQALAGATRGAAAVRAGKAAAAGKTTLKPGQVAKQATGRTATPTATSPAARRRAACTSPVQQTRTSPLGRLRTRAQAKTDQARAQVRASRDQAVESRRDRIKLGRKAAKARAILGRRVAASGTRYGIAAAARGALAAPVGALGMLTTPLGRKLGWAWLQYPGRRLFRRLIARARTDHQNRVLNARKQHADQLNSLNPATPEEAPPIADTVDRAPRTHGPTITGDPDVSEDIKLHFLEASEETVSAARAYEPGGMLHVRQVIKAMPVALENWAATFAVLAEKSDAEFPLEGEIGEGLDDIHQQMRALIDQAEELAKTFDRLHEHDIERLRNPRKSAEAEKSWDTGANEDYDAE